jgi:hypothetical protein
MQRTVLSSEYKQALSKYASEPFQLKKETDSVAETMCSFNRPDKGTEKA